MLLKTAWPYVYLFVHARNILLYTDMSNNIVAKAGGAVCHDAGAGTRYDTFWDVGTSVVVPPLTWILRGILVALSLDGG
jgi:hypothetical protein